MKVLLLGLLCTISFSASAQWWRLGKNKRYPLIAQAQTPVLRLTAAKLSPAKVTRVAIGQTVYGLAMSEHVVMKIAQHQMRFREYENASYSFNQLAKIYVRLNHLSEAKWFFLQSNNLSRQQNNDRLTIANLIELSNVKQAIGDFSLAQQDLEEARDMAKMHNWQDDMQTVKKQLDNLQLTKLAALKPEAGFGKAGQTTL